MLLEAAMFRYPSFAFHADTPIVRALGPYELAVWIAEARLRSIVFTLENDLDDAIERAEFCRLDLLKQVRNLLDVHGPELFSEEVRTLGQLIKAVDAIDLSKPYEFSTYADAGDRARIDLPQPYRISAYERRLAERSWNKTWLVDMLETAPAIPRNAQAAPKRRRRY